VSKLARGRPFRVFFYLQRKTNQEADVVGNGANNDGDLVLLALELLGNLRERERCPVDLAHKQALEDDLVERGIGAASKEAVQLDEQRNVHVLGLLLGTVGTRLVLAANNVDALWTQKGYNLNTGNVGLQFGKRHNPIHPTPVPNPQSALSLTSLAAFPCPALPAPRAPPPPPQLPLSNDRSGMPRSRFVSCVPWFKSAKERDRIRHMTSNLINHGCHQLKPPERARVVARARGGRHRAPNERDLLRAAECRGCRAVFERRCLGAVCPCDIDDDINSKGDRGSTSDTAATATTAAKGVWVHACVLCLYTISCQGDADLQNVFNRLEAIGYQVGVRLTERHASNLSRFADQMECVKFICRDLWSLMFKKQADNLKTNHKVTR